MPRLDLSPVSSTTPIYGFAMSSPIGFREFSEVEYRKFIRTLSDQELLKAGKRLRILCGEVVTPTPGTFDRQLEICREEYRRSGRLVDAEIKAIIETTEGGIRWQVSFGNETARI